jgi:hypothetical protein
MCVCVCVYIYIYIYIYIYTHIHIHTFIYIFIYLFIYNEECMPAMRVRTHACTHACIPIADVYARNMLACMHAFIAFDVT